MTHYWGLAIIVVTLFVSASRSGGQPETYAVGVIVDDQLLPEQLPPHMLRIHPIVIDEFNRHVRALLEATGRCRILNLTKSARRLMDREAIDFVLVVTLYKLGKSYRNRVYYFREGDVFDAVVKPQMEQDFPYEVVSEPSAVIQFGMELMDSEDRVMWSSIIDSTEIVPYDSQIYLYNTDRYPGVTHPDLLQRYHSGLTRLRLGTPQVDRMLEVSDRWFVSGPRDDLETLRSLLESAVVSSYGELDGHIPLAGRILAVEPTKKKDKPKLTLGIGYRHGAVPKMRLQVRRAGGEGGKVGEIEIVEVDSLSSIAKTRKIEKKLRNRGESFQVGDRVISKRRRSSRTWIP